MADTTLQDAAAAPTVDALDALRARGAARIEPVRWHLIEALARRARWLDGAARRVVDDRLAALIAACDERLTQAQDKAVQVPVATAPARGPLAELADRLGRGAARPDTTASTTPPAHPAASTDPSPVDPQALQFFRRTWSRLSADQRLTQSLSALPENAGPLNSHQLVHRALTTMRELSPAYFEQFMAYVDALLWLEHANGSGADDAALAPRTQPARKTSRPR